MPTAHINFCSLAVHWPLQTSIVIHWAKAILCGDSLECEIPDGWGASGSPNDGFHQFVHLLAKIYAQTNIRWTSDFDLRTSLDRMQQSVGEPAVYLAILRVCHFLGG